MWLRAAVLGLGTAVAACFAPELPVGLPCAAGEACPAGQTCRGGVCELGGDRIDAPGAADAADAPPAIDAAPGAPDARTDCWAAWQAGTPAFGAIRELAEVSAAVSEENPYLTPDHLRLYFSRNTGGSRDILVAARPDRAAAFGPPGVVADLSSTDDDTRVTLTADGLVAVLAREVAPDDHDLFEATRASTAQPFGAMSSAPYVALNDTFNQHDPWISADGLRLYYAPGSASGQVLRLASRASRGAAFGPSAVVAGITPAITFDPSVSPDERVIVYAGATSGMEPGDLYVARRATPSGPFTGATPLAALNTGDVEADPALSADGCELIFGSNRPGGTGGRDLYLVTVLPGP